MNLNELSRRLKAWRTPADPERLAAEESLNFAIGERSVAIAESWDWAEKAERLADHGTVWKIAHAGGSYANPAPVRALAGMAMVENSTFYDGDLLLMCDRYYSQLNDETRAAFDEAMRLVDDAAIRAAERELTEE